MRPDRAGSFGCWGSVTSLGSGVVTSSLRSMHGLPNMELSWLSRLYKLHHVWTVACLHFGSDDEYWDCVWRPKVMAARSATPTVTHALRIWLAIFLTYRGTRPHHVRYDANSLYENRITKTHITPYLPIDMTNSHIVESEKPGGLG
jgi:hypothetical protein